MSAAVVWSDAIERLAEHLGVEEVDVFFGDVMTTAEWLAAVDGGVFIDYDGYAEPLVMNAERRGRVLAPSEHFVTPYPPERRPRLRVEQRVHNRRRLLANCRYVVWFNR